MSGDVFDPVGTHERGTIAAASSQAKPENTSETDNDSRTPSGAGDAPEGSSNPSPSIPPMTPPETPPTIPPTIPPETPPTITPEIQPETPPLITGIHHPRIDGILYGHTGQAIPEDRAGEWADAVRRDVPLDAIEGGDLQATSYVKQVDGRLYVGLRLPQGIHSDEVTRIAVQIDRDGSGNLTNGDLLFVGEFAGGTVAEGNPGRTWEVHVFRNGEFGRATGLRGVDSGVVSLSPGGEPGLTVEATLNVQAIEGRLGGAEGNADTDSNDESSGSGGPSESTPGGYGIRIETTGNAYCTPTCPNWVGTYHEYLLDEEQLDRLRDLPGIEVGVDHIEIMQGVQKADNSLRVARDRQTLARAFVTHNQSTPTRILVRFNAWNVSREGRTYLGEDTVAYTAPPGSPDRSDLSDSANLELPASWTDNPRLELQVSVGATSYTDATPADNDARVTKSFVDTHDLAIYRIRVNTNTSSTPKQPSKANMRAVSSGLVDRYPTTPRFWNLGWEVIGAQGPSVSRSALLKDLDSAGTRLEAGWRYVWRATGSEPGFPYPEQMYGIAKIRGKSDPTWGAGPGNAVAAFGSFYSATMAHEVNHNIGNGSWGRHVNVSRQNGVGADGCGAGGTDPLWNTRFSDHKTHALGWKPGSGLVDATADDFMTYCVPNRWVSDYRWELLIDRLWTFQKGEPIHPHLQTYGDGAPRPSGKDVLGREVPTMRVVSGAVFPNGSGTLDPSFEQPGIAGEPDREARNPDAVIRIVRVDGSVDRIPIDARFTGVEGEQLDRSTFSVGVHDNSTIRAIRLVNAETGEVIDSQEATGWELQNVSIRTPQQFGRGQLTEIGVRVSAEGAPELHKRLLYSPDPDRGLWFPIGSATTGDTIPVTFTELPGGNDARFLLLVTDGVSTRFAVSDPFTVPPDPPAVTIERTERWEADLQQANPPGPGGMEELRNVAGPVTATVGAPVSLDVQAIDQHGGQLEGERIQWTATDEQGNVVATDTGGRFTHRFSDPGEYELNVEATDPGTDLSTTDSIDVVVKRPPLPDEDDVAALEDARETRREGSDPRDEPADP